MRKIQDGKDQNTIEYFHQGKEKSRERSGLERVVQIRENKVREFGGGGHERKKINM